MKPLLLTLVVILFSLIGYFYKDGFKKEIKYYTELLDFLNYYKIKISLLKNNIVEIIDEYQNMHLNKNANLIKIFEKTDNIYKINQNILNKYIFDENNKKIISDYFNIFGKLGYDIEIDKCDSFINLINVKIDTSNKNLKTKGDLYFKIFIFIGVIIAILFW